MIWRSGVGVACAVAAFACAPRSSQPSLPSSPSTGSATSNGAEIGKPSPPFTRTSLTGERVSVPSKREATAVIFFATWSSPDMLLLTHMQEISLTHPELAVIAVSIDDEARNVLEVARGRGARYPIVWDMGHELVNLYRMSLDPMVVLLDKENVVRFIHGGYHDGEQYEIDDEVASLLNKDICGHPLRPDSGPGCFRQCERLTVAEAKCTTADCKARCSALSRPCVDTCTKSNKYRNAALEICRQKRPSTREACLAACHTEEIGNAMHSCEYQSGGQRPLLDECAAACGVGECRASCLRLKQ